MNHHPSGNSAKATVPSSTAAKPEAAYHLNPSLQRALACLDIKLEDELTRFRHQIAHQGSEQRSINDDTDSSTTLVGEKLQPAISSTTIIEKDEYEVIPPSGGFVVIDGSPTPENGFSAITTVNYAPLTIYREDISVPYQSLDLNFSNGGQIAPFREEYVASSQELLRQIQAGATTPPDTFGDRVQTAPVPAKRQWANPIKLGSMAAVACVVVGAGLYAHLNPTILAPFTATNVGTISTTTNSLGQLVQSPNLAANEFTELNLSTLNTVKIATATPTTTNVSTIANPVGTPTATTSGAIPFTPVNPQSILPPTTTTSVQPKLADSLLKSLLPSNFQTLTRQPQRPMLQPGVRR
jgi:hypothetical protein